MLTTWFTRVTTHEQFFREIADYLIHLGYRPQLMPTKDLIVIFSKRGKKIAKFAYSHQQGASFHMKFYAAPSYPVYCQECLKHTIEEFDYRYTGMIQGAIAHVGYQYHYPDGRDYFYFHLEMIDMKLPPLEVIDELKLLLHIQDDYWQQGGL